MKLEFKVKTERRVQFINIDHLLLDAVRKGEIQNAVCHIFIPHTTAAVTINENADPDVMRDIQMETGKIVPFEDNYAHAEGNSAAHIKASLFGATATVFISEGKPNFGTWQSLFFCEFDGPRQRRIWITFIPMEF
ncbi:MAG: secondary thiamine-phosphate synthase enzyme YjbQ [bacterium]